MTQSLWPTLTLLMSSSRSSHVEGEGAHIVDDPPGSAGGGGVDGVPCLEVLLNHGTRDGRGDGVVPAGPGRWPGEFGYAWREAEFSILWRWSRWRRFCEGAVAHPVPLVDIELLNLAGSFGHHSASGGIGKVAEEEHAAAPTMAVPLVESEMAPG